MPSPKPAFVTPRQAAAANATHHEPLGYRTDEAARVLGIGRSQLFKLLADGSIRSVKVGRMRLISRAELERFLARGPRQ